MSQVPFFSVVIPVYNKGPHIQRSISSVLNQTFQDFELILINDASTDNSLEEMQKVTDTRIRILHRDEPGPGGYAARNLGIKEAKAEWVAFLDADDEWLPEHLSTVYNLRQSYPTASFFTSGWLIGDGEDFVKNPFLQENEDLGAIDGIGVKRYLKIQSTGKDLVNTDVAVVKKTVLDKIGGFPVPSSRCKRAGDGQTWLRAMLAGAKMVWSPHIGAVHYLGCGKYGDKEASLYH